MSESEEYLRGYDDCFQGLPAKLNQSEEYNRGYNARYTLEQNLGCEA